MENVILTLNKKPEEVKDSMQFDSYTEIARLTFVENGEEIASAIEVRGEVEVEYKKKTYLAPSDFPKKLVSMIKKGRDWEHNPDVFVSMNNWFEVFVDDEDSRSFQSDCIDLNSNSAEEIYSLMANYIKKIRKIQLPDFSEITVEENYS